MKREKKASTQANCGRPFGDPMKFLTPVLATLLLLVAIPVLAQSQEQAARSTKPQTPDSSTPAQPSPEKKKPKKVWTNDELGKSGGGVSVVGEPAAPSADTKQKPDTTTAKDEARQRQINDYKEQLAKLQAQIDAADKRIDQLKNFHGENSSPSGGINMNQGYNMVPISDQIQQLEDKKKQIRAKMDDLENEAHKNGITSDELR